MVLGGDGAGRHRLPTSNTDELQQRLGESVRLAKQHVEAAYRHVVGTDAG